MVSSFNHSQLANSKNHQNNDQLSITIEVVSLDFPDAAALSQAFERIRNLPNYLKPIVLEILARRLAVSKKTIEKSFQIWTMEQIKLTATQDNQQNREGR